MRYLTYIAGDWDGDSYAVEQLYKWKNSSKWTLYFPDAHETRQARDSSLYCSVKVSLKKRLDESNVFVLIVGDSTNSVTKGGCQLCSSYNSWNSWCARAGRTIDYRSYVKYECDEAAKAVQYGMKIVVLYNSTTVDRSKCPESVRWLGKHVSMVYRSMDGRYYWDYDTVYSALIN